MSNSHSCLSNSSCSSPSGHAWRAGSGGGSRWEKQEGAGGGYKRVLLVIMIYLLLLVEGGSNSKPGGLEEVCQWKAFTPKCEEDEVVVMEKATYGRMHIGRCVVEDLGYLGCQADVLGMADRKCSGRRSCEVQIPDQDFERTNPCSERQSYLEAQYRCVKVEGTDRRQCGSCDYVKLTAPSGYIASATTAETGCGTADCPWLIEALPGQQIRIRLYDFGYPIGTTETIENLNVCRVYAVLKEESTKRSVTICGGQQREKDAYTTTGNTLEVRFLGKSNNAESIYFMLHYTVLGCPDRAPPRGGWFKRHGDTALVGCSASEDTWRITCNGTHWIGVHGECPEDGRTVASLVVSNFSFEISIAIVIIIAVFVGTLILIIGLVCFRRHSTIPNNSRPGGRIPDEAIYEERMHHHPAAIPQYTEHEENAHNTMKSTRSKTYSDVRNEYAHIWEMPLPQQPALLQKQDPRDMNVPPLPAPLPMPPEI